mgnify:CR=1 FL=1
MPVSLEWHIPINLHSKILYVYIVVIMSGVCMLNQLPHYHHYTISLLIILDFTLGIHAIYNEGKCQYNK